MCICFIDIIQPCDAQYTYKSVQSLETPHRTSSCTSPELFGVSRVKTHSAASYNRRADKTKSVDAPKPPAITGKIEWLFLGTRKAAESFYHIEHRTAYCARPYHSPGSDTAVLGRLLQLPHPPSSTVPGRSLSESVH